jgi:hypothetical protein
MSEFRQEKKVNVELVMLQRVEADLKEVVQAPVDVTGLWQGWSQYSAGSQ